MYLGRVASPNALKSSRLRQDAGSSASWRNFDHVVEA